AGAVAPHDPEELALVDVERHVAQHPLRAVLDARERMGRALLERVDPVARDAERLVQPAHLDNHRPVRRRRATAGDRGPAAGVDRHQDQQYHARAMTFPDLAALKEFAGWKAARAPHAARPSRDPDGLRSAYLGLL